MSDDKLLTDHSLAFSPVTEAISVFPITSAFLASSKQQALVKKVLSLSSLIRQLITQRVRATFQFSKEKDFQVFIVSFRIEQLCVSKYFCFHVKTK